jgi:carbon-monoxide dehydrogenase small subunit
MKSLIHMTINDKEYELAVQPNQTLVDVLRYELRLTGTKKGCGTGDCGSCTVIMDGKPVNSCLVLAVQANGRKIYGKRRHPVRILFPRHDSLLEKPAG